MPRNPEIINAAVERAGGGKNILKKEVASLRKLHKKIERSPKLSNQRKVFLQAYLRNGYNVRRAARTAGYSETNPYVYKIIKEEPYVTLIRQHREALTQSLKVTPDRIVEELAKMAFVNLSDFMEINDDDGTATIDLSQVTHEQLAGITEITTEEVLEGKAANGKPVKIRRVKIKLASKREALELLGRHKKMFTEKMELTGADGQPLAPPPLIVVAKNFSNALLPGKKVVTEEEE